MDDFISLSNRLLNRAPGVGIVLARQFINDAWSTLQSRQEWSWRRRFGTFAPPTLYQTGSASTNVAVGQPTLITGVGTTWTPQMVGRQIRLSGLGYPYYTIVAYVSATQIMIDQPWAGPDLALVPYQILQCYYPVPDDFGYWYCVLSPKNGYQLWTNVTQMELASADPQRTNQGETYGVSFRDYTSQLSGVVGPVIAAGATGAAPVSTTTLGYSYVVNATYIIQISTPGASGAATYKWMRAGQTGFSPPVAVVTSTDAQDLMDGVQVYWPTGVTYNAGDVFVINCTANVTSGVPRYELWPSPTSNTYLYPYTYIAKEYALTQQQPQLPPFVANRGEILIEMGLGKAATFPGADKDHPNPYFNLTLAGRHETKAEQLIWDLERNDQEVGLTNITYQQSPFAPAPWGDGRWQQTHAPFLA